MAGFSRFYVIGGLGGYLGADGVNPIELLILVGDADRQWLEPHYFDKTAGPLGSLEVVVPAAPDHPDSLLDACLAFCPRHFSSCHSLAEVSSALRGVRRLDFDLGAEDVPSGWSRLREEARAAFGELNIWRADLTLLSEGRSNGLS